MKWTLKKVKQVAKDMNEVMGLDPEIPTEDVELEELIEICKKEAAEAAPTDDFTDLTWKFFEEFGVGPEREDEADEEPEAEADEEPEAEADEEPEAEAEKPKKAKKEKADKPKKEKKAKKKKADKPKKADETEPKIKKARGTGVIASIVDILTNAPEEGLTKEEILDELCVRFPFRKRDSMKGTVAVQVPTRLRKERGLNVVSKDGRYRIV